GMLQARKTVHKVSKDDVFTLEDSQLQGFLTALHNGKKVSIKQGLDVTANQDEATDTEIFQVELDKKAQAHCRIRTCQNTLWVLDAASSGIQTGSATRSADALFRIEWLDDGAMAMKASNDRYVTSRPNGSLYAVSTEISTKEKFYFSVVNRPLLMLRCEHGFVGTKKGAD
ncbi:hypothetical protein GH890_29830, partial [Bacillus thuringiensis]|nr:hypothetical protein [Bacillus thuringiensis]